MKTSQTLALLSSIALGSADFLAPARGQTLEIDEEFTARWETDGLVEPIDISLVPVGNENAAQKVAAGVDNSGSVAFTPDASLGQFDQFELVLTDSDDNTVTSDAFGIDSGNGNGGAQAASNRQGGNGRVSANSAGGRGNQGQQASNDEEDGEDSGASGRVSAAVEPPDSNAQTQRGAGGNNQAATGTTGAGNNAAGGNTGGFIPLSGDQLTITPTFASAQQANFITDAAQIATNEGVVPNVGVINSQASQATADVNIRTVPAVETSAAAVDGAIPVATPPVAVIDPAAASSQAGLIVDGGVAQTGALSLNPVPSAAVGVPQAGFSVINPGAGATAIGSVASVAPIAPVASIDASAIAADPNAAASVSAEVIGGAAAIPGVATDVLEASTAIAGAVSLDPLASDAAETAAFAADSLAPIATPGVFPSVGVGAPGAIAGTGLTISPTIVPGGQFTNTLPAVPTGSVPTPIINPSGAVGGIGTGVVGGIGAGGVGTGANSFATNVLNSASGLVFSSINVGASATGVNAQATGVTVAAAPGLSARGALVGGIAVLVALWVM